MITLLNPPRKGKNKRKKGRGKSKRLPGLLKWACRKDFDKKIASALKKCNSRKTKLEKARLAKIEKRSRKAAKRASKRPLLGSSTLGSSSFFAPAETSSRYGPMGLSVSDAIGLNPGRRSKRSRARNGSTWIPAFANPSAYVQDAKAGFSPNVLKAGVSVLVGVALNKVVSGFLQKQTWTPAFLDSGVGAVILKIATAGIGYAVTNKVMPQYAKGVLTGGMYDAVSTGFEAYLYPNLPASIRPMHGFEGLGDYLTVGSAERAVPLMGMGDYLSVGNAAGAVPLMGVDDVLQSSGVDM